VSFEIAALATGYLVTGHLVARLRRGNVAKHFVGSSQIDVTTAAEPNVAFDTIKHIDRPYRVDDADPATLRIVLSSPPNPLSWGFFYPVEIKARDGGSKITIGIKSRFVFGGIIQTTRAHERCARAIEALFAGPPMQIA